MFQSCPDPFCHALSVIQLIVSPGSAFEYAVFQRFFVNDCAVEHPPDLVLQPERFRRRLYRCRYIPMLSSIAWLMNSDAEPFDGLER